MGRDMYKYEFLLHTLKKLYCQSYAESERDRTRNVLSVYYQMATTGPNHGQAQKILPVLRGCGGPRAWTTLHCFLRLLDLKVENPGPKPNAIVASSCSLQLYHNTSPITMFALP